ncbi:unnamed protein product [Nezara viridula]|uniref:Rap guanine nucleotide exchange factor 4 n=1 Tax=Nezara viridula TaxID=85310 RepID=A0A9P0HRZ0_NEZVI|nr:unnamed protein product [Nezara viridula]
MEGMVRHGSQIVPAQSVMLLTVYCLALSLVYKWRRCLSAGLGGVVKSQSPSPPLTQGKRGLSPDTSDPTKPITEMPSMEMARAGWVLRTLLLNEQEQVLRERKTAGGRMSVPMAASGSELVSWLISLEAGLDRQRATTMWQALLEEGIIFHVTGEHEFRDKCVLYQFRSDRDGIAGGCTTPQDIAEAEEHLQECLADLADRGPDAWLRMVLRKSSNDRTADDLEIIYEELLHMKPLSHLSNSMKRELASVIMFEAHPRPGSVVFEQGEEGRSWYLVLCGSVDVVIHGKGVVATLHAGEDFGKLALINEAPRAASIIVREDNTHLLRVGKDDFNRILRDVEANTVRLKEHGKDVLILEKSQGPHSSVKYVVMACTPARMVEHLLDSRLDSGSIDPALDDFLLTHELSNDASSEGWEEAALMHRLIIFRVYCADHTYCTLRLPVSATAEQIKVCAADKLGLRVRPEDLILAELKSNGERVNFRDVEVSVPTSLSLNGRIFVAPKDHLDALTVIAEQEAPTEGVELDLEDVSAKEMAYHMTICKQYHNINGMFALVLGLSNMAVSRLSLTWDKLPSKSRKLYMQLEATIDPSKNHRAYRGVVSSMDSPLVPFMPLLLKVIEDPPTPKNESEVRAYVRCLRTIDNQRTLTSLSQKLEPRRS